MARLTPNHLIGFTAPVCKIVIHCIAEYVESIHSVPETNPVKGDGSFELHEYLQDFIDVDRFWLEG